ncbi:uncharacterized protein B0T15DRAFT_506834 [Chaetomium strumarium]|uniref:pH-response regulator protein palC n=1 Tax=Chaetomium strumarium TaxID=1170767 RepID=A0AAJ0H1N1_9PEZI|nr:hypothetical protein B0T15DRAFT_506834 [Chaetomium strumarium]
MPYPFVLPTTSSFAFSSSFTCESHPSLPLQASTHRGVVRDTLKRHKRLPATSQPASLSSVISALHSYLPYLFAIDAGLSNKTIHSEEVSVILKTAPLIEWRPTLSGNLLPGRERPRTKIHSLEYELFFALSTLANAFTLQSRAALQPLYQTTNAPVGTAQRQTAIATATRHLLDAASIYTYLASRAESLPPDCPPPPCADIATTTLRAQRALALAEATLLAVLKDDPYPAVVAQARNPHDTEWMYKAPDIPKVRAHLFARLCLAAGEHAAQAAAALGTRAGGKGASSSVSDGFVRYLDDLRRASRARACRFFGIDAELGGQTGTAIAWLRAGLAELGVERKGDGGKGTGLKGLRKEWSERREDKKVEKGLDWGADGGRLEETRVIEMLEVKWTKQNDTMLTQPIPPTGPLLAQMPSGREIHSIKPFEPPLLAPDMLEAMRAPPDRSDEFGDYPSSDEETAVDPSPGGTFTGRSSDYRTGTPGYF